MPSGGAGLADGRQLAAGRLRPRSGLSPARLEVPAAFRATPASQAAAWPDEAWWQGFSAPELDRLMAAARVQNFDIAAAVARVRQADAQLRIAGAPLLPTVTATGNAAWQKSSTAGRPGVRRQRPVALSTA